MYFYVRDISGGHVISSLTPDINSLEKVARLAEYYPEYIYFEADLVPPIGDIIEMVIKESPTWNDYGPGCGACGPVVRGRDCPCPQMPWPERNNNG